MAGSPLSQGMARALRKRNAGASRRFGNAMARSDRSDAWPAGRAAPLGVRAWLPSEADVRSSFCSADGVGLVPVLLAVGLGAAARSMFGAIPWWGVSAGGMLSLLTMLAWGFRRVIWQLRNQERAYVRPYGPVPAPPGWMVAMSLLGAMLLGAARTGPATLEALSGVVVAGEWLVMGGRAGGG